MPRYLAFDLGAESGRAIVGTVADGRVGIEEVHRFPNRQVSEAGHLHWDVPYLFGELKKGLSLALGRGELASLGIDSWGVDFALVGADGALREPPYSYRDSRTDGVMPRVFAKMSREEIFAATGTQCMQINSLFQLYAARQAEPRGLDASTRLLLIADLFNFLFTGVQCSEYTLATTSQLLNAPRREWDRELFARVGLPLSLMAPIVQPGTVIGPVSPGILREARGEAAKPVNVVAVGCHDTASAVAAVPAGGDDWAFLSSGTWSVIGAELGGPILTADALAHGFGNEGGVGGTIRFLRNVMGMWLLEELRRGWQREGKVYGHDDVAALASAAGKAEATIDPEDRAFLNPPDMAEAIRGYCRRTGQREPRTDGELVRCVLESLALKYGAVLSTLNRVAGRSVARLHIVGGGSRNDLLNQMTSDVCGVPVSAGPVEAAALGNILVQAMAGGAVASVAEGREIVRRSFPVKEFRPNDQGR